MENQLTSTKDGLRDALVVSAVADSIRDSFLMQATATLAAVYLEHVAAIRQQEIRFEEVETFIRDSKTAIKNVFNT